jgi:mRNA interferase MazF
MRSTTTYSPGELLLVPVPYTKGGGSTTRPALVLVDTGDADVLLARITSQPQTSPCDVAIVDWRGAGLRKPSFIRLHKLVTVDKSEIQRSLGNLQPADRAAVSAVLRQLHGNW